MRGFVDRVGRAGENGGVWSYRGCWNCTGPPDGLEFMVWGDEEEPNPAPLMGMLLLLLMKEGLAMATGGIGKGTATPVVRFSDPKSSSFIIAADMLGLGPPTFFPAAAVLIPDIGVNQREKWCYFVS